MLLLFYVLLILICEEVVIGLQEYFDKEETQFQSIKVLCKQLNSHKTLTALWPTARLLCALNHYIAATSSPRQIAAGFFNVVIKMILNFDFLLDMPLVLAGGCQIWSFSRDV